MEGRVGGEQPIGEPLPWNSCWVCARLLELKVPVVTQGERAHISHFPLHALPWGRAFCSHEVSLGTCYLAASLQHPVGLTRPTLNVRLFPQFSRKREEALKHMPKH